MDFIEFPKMLYKGADSVVAHTAEDEAALEAKGYKAPESAAAPKPEKPKPCPKCPGLQTQVDDLTVQVDELNKQLVAAKAPAVAAKAKV